ncbi:hypothetical protein BDV06DRAFT_201147 [Aspergillus oleicola]
MHRMLTRGAPAAPTSHCIACLNASAEGIATRTASTASKRRLHTKNSVTALYTSIFAAAALTDARAKTRRRQEWADKIAAVKQEVNDLVDEEQRLISVLSSRRTAHPLRRPVQTRSYHTLPRPTPRIARLSNLHPPCRLSHSASGDISTEDNATEGGIEDQGLMKELESETLAPLEGDGEDFDMAIDVEEIPHWLRTDLYRAKAIKRLALKQLAIRFLLRQAIAHDYFGILKNYGSDGEVPKLDLAGLLFELSAIRRRLRQIKANPHSNIDDLLKDIRVRRLEDTVNGNQSLNDKVRLDTNLYLRGQMPLEELLLRLSSHLLQVQDPDQAFAFTRMLVAFTKSRQNDLAELVIKSILPYKFQLNHALILTTLNFFRKSKDLKGFDLFLQMLEGKGYPIDMGNLGYYRRKVINGIAISIPPVEGTNTIIYATLIKACLRFDQPARADAYLLAARAAGIADDFAILTSYVEFYTIRRDSEKALQVLQRCLAWIASTTEHPVEPVERLIAKMVKLSDACHMPELSMGLIDAAVGSGFSADIPRRQKDITFHADPQLQRWSEAARTSVPDAEAMGHPCYAFAKSAKQHIDALIKPQEESSDRRMSKILGSHSSQLLDSTLSWKATPAAAEMGNQRESAGNVMTTAEGNEVAALRSEVAQLKELVMRLYQPTSSPTSTPSSKATLADTTPVSDGLPQKKQASE